MCVRGFFVKELSPCDDDFLLLFPLFFAPKEQAKKFSKVEKGCALNWANGDLRKKGKEETRLARITGVFAVVHLELPFCVTQSLR